MNFDTADIKYSYEEFDNSQESIFRIFLVYGELNNIAKKKIVACERKGDIKIHDLYLATIFSFQQQFKELKNEKGKMRILIKKGNDTISLKSDQQLKSYFKDLINEFKNEG